MTAVLEQKRTYLNQEASRPAGYMSYISGEDIYQRLKDDILTLKLKPGQMISENEIASIYNVSRTPIKTAFLRLKGEKYIEILPQKGSYVTLLDMAYIRDVIYMRFLLEMNMFETLMKSHRTDEAIASLEANLAQQSALINSPDIDPASFYGIDSAFHLTAFSLAGRRKMWDIIQDCQVYYTRFRILDTMTTARYQELHSEHAQILAAFKDGDLAKLRTCVHDHLHGNIRILSAKIADEYKDYFVSEE